MNGFHDTWGDIDPNSVEPKAQREPQIPNASWPGSGRENRDHHGRQDPESELTLDQVEKDEHIARTIEAEIIPRLLLAHRASRLSREAAAEPSPVATQEPFTAWQIAEFAAVVVGQPIRVAIDYIDVLIAEGTTVEAIFLDVFSPTARYLGTEWEEDRLSFVDVSLGLSRLQQLLRVYSPIFEAEAPSHRDGHRILLAAMPGEMHTFGMSVVEEFFRRDGWDVQCEAGLTRSELLMRSRSEWFDVVGLSASAAASVALLSPLIQSIRDTAMNQEIRVIVGGCAFLAEPANALALGADLVARNGREAVVDVDKLLNAARTG